MIQRHAIYKRKTHNIFKDTNMLKINRWKRDNLTIIDEEFNISLLIINVTKQKINKKTEGLNNTTHQLNLTDVRILQTAMAAIHNILNYSGKILRD